MAWVLENSQAEGYGRLVLLAIANHADHSGTNAFPSVEKIAHEARVSRATVFRVLPKLVGLGELTIEKGGAGAGSTNRYHVQMKGSQTATLQGSQAETLQPQIRVSETPNKGLTAATQTVIPRTELHAGARARALQSVRDCLATATPTTPKKGSP